MEVWTRVRKFGSSGIKVQVHDPMTCANETKHEYDIELMSMDGLQPADAVIVAVAHNSYVREGWRLPQRLLCNGTGLVFDIRGMLERATKPHGIDLWRL
jgi:UDP-N-acetyl-D-galactosamine dehydrogenase